MCQIASVKQRRALSSVVRVDLFIKISSLVGVQTFALATSKPGGPDRSPTARMQAQVLLVPPCRSA